MQQLSPTDTAIRMNDRPHSPNLLTWIGIYDPATTPRPVTYQDVVRRIEERLPVAPCLTSKLVGVPFDLDLPYWVPDPDLELGFHVRHIALPPPGTWQQFRTQVARIGARPLDMTRPLWEAYLIEGLDALDGVPTGAFALLVKLHRAAAGGSALPDLVDRLHDVQVPAQPGPAGSEQVPSTADLLWEAARNAAGRPVQLARLVVSAIPAARHAPAALTRLPSALRPGTETGATRFNGPVTPHRVWDTRAYPLADVERVAAAVPDATVDDVLVALVGGALRAYLTGHDELPARSLTADVAIPGRSETGPRAPGDRPATTRVALGTDLAEPLERVVAVQRATAQAQPPGAGALPALAQLLPAVLPDLASRTVSAVASRAGVALGAHTVVTDVPGSSAPLAFGGARLVRAGGMPPALDGTGLAHAIGRHGDEVTVSYTADRDMLPDPDTYSACLDASLKELLEAVG